MTNSIELNPEDEIILNVLKAALIDETAGAVNATVADAVGQAIGDPDFRTKLEAALAARRPTTNVGPLFLP